MQAVANGQALGSAIGVTVGTDRLDVRVPPRMASLVRGSATLYRAANARADRTVALVPAPDGTQVIPTAGLAPGQWRLQLRWSADGPRLLRRTRHPTCHDRPARRARLRTRRQRPLCRDVRPTGAAGQSDARGGCRCGAGVAGAAGHRTPRSITAAGRSPTSGWVRSRDSSAARWRASGLGRALAVIAGVALLLQALAATRVIATRLGSLGVAPVITRALGRAGTWMRTHRVQGPLVFGALNGLLPCGLLYAALTAAAGFGDLREALAVHGRIRPGHDPGAGAARARRWIASALACRVGSVAPRPWRSRSSACCSSRGAFAPRTLVTARRRPWPATPVGRGQPPRRIHAICRHATTAALGHAALPSESRPTRRRARGRIGRCGRRASIA